MMFIPVHRRRALVHLAYLMHLAGVKKYTFGRRGLARVDVRHYTDIARIFE